MIKKLFFLLVVGVLTNNTIAFAQNDTARLMRFPTMHDNTVVFSYAGDLYSVNKDGGYATKMTNDVGYEMFARFSPDGKNLAFTGQYDGNTEVYEMPAVGGEPKRLTYTATLHRDDIGDRMGPNNITMTWKDNEHIVYRSREISFNDFQGQLFLADVNGGMSEQLPLPRGGFCSYNSDKTKLAYNQVFREFRTWKYYEGGMADDIWIYDFATKQTINVTNNLHQDIQPMWAGDKIYFLSDRDRTMNLFCYDVTTKAIRKVTNYTDYDIKFPSLGNNSIVWERGGYLYYMDLATEQIHWIPVMLAGDNIYSRSEMIDASKFFESSSISPDGNRMLMVGRGDVWTIPAKDGITRNLTQSSGAHDRNAQWSPDGKWIAYISDATGEDEIYTIAQDGSSAPNQITTGQNNYKYYFLWSPDSKKILWSDRTQTLYYTDVVMKQTIKVDYDSVQEFNDYTWSPDSKWIAYGKAEIQTKGRIYLYNLNTKNSTPATDGWYSAYQPSFSDDGKYLFFVSDRDFSPTFSNADFNAAYLDMSRIYFITLSKDTPSPFMEKNDEQKIETTPDVPATTTSSSPKKDKNKKDTTAAKPNAETKIDLDGIVDRVIGLPVSPSGYFGITAIGNKVYYMVHGSSDDGSTLKVFDLDEQEEINVASVDGYEISFDHKKILLSKGSDHYIMDVPHGKVSSLDGKVDLSNCKVWVDKHAEWKQIYTESWRQMRDFFYAPNMQGVNWIANYNKYLPLIKYVNNREDLTYIIGEMIGELNIGHSYCGGGDIPKVEKIKMGMLGASLSKDASTGYFKITKILDGANWDEALHSPLNDVGLNIHAGNFIIAVNGTPTNSVADFYQLMVGKANVDVELTINTTASAMGSRKVIVKPIAEEGPLYYYEWVQHNIHYVDSVSHGQIGYIHIPNMGEEGLNMFMKLFYPQINRAALIIDDRGNGGGFVSPLVTERLAKQVVFWDFMRNSEPQADPETQWGPKVCLVNEYSASDGDIFPYRFKTYKLGKIIGKRTWGGVVGIRGTLPFVDGGFLNRPEFSRFDTNGNWVLEGHGIDPDIEVSNDPATEWSGIDQQLNKGIEVILEQLKTWPTKPDMPPYPDKTKIH